MGRFEAGLNGGKCQPKFALPPKFFIRLDIFLRL
jgi:hypothetical protein